MQTFAFSSIALFISVALAAGQSKTPAKEPLTVDPTIPKGAEHIVIKEGDKDAKAVFTYFPYPDMPTIHRVTPLARSGCYPLEVNPDGTVAAVTVLRTMGKNFDLWAMKGFVRWKAKPGGLRVVDVPYSIGYYSGGSHTYP